LDLSPTEVPAIDTEVQNNMIDFDIADLDLPQANPPRT